MFDTYIINLDRHIENFYKLQQIYRSYGINPVRVSAVDASKKEHLNYPEKVNKYCREMCNEIAIAISLSHYKVAEEFLKTGKEYCLVLEDDAYPIEEIHNIKEEILKLIDSVPKDWDFILLYCQGNCPKGSKETNWLSGSSAAYVMSRSGAIKEQKKQITYHHDMMRANDKSLNIYKSPYNYFITDESSSGNRQNKKNFLTKVKMNLADFFYYDPEHMDYSVMSDFYVYKDIINVDILFNIFVVLVCIYTFIVIKI